MNRSGKSYLATLNPINECPSEEVGNFSRKKLFYILHPQWLNNLYYIYICFIFVHLMLSFMITYVCVLFLPTPKEKMGEPLTKKYFNSSIINQPKFMCHREVI